MRQVTAKIVLAENPIMRKSPYAGNIFNGAGRPIDLNRPVQTLPASMGGNKTPIVDERELREETKPWIVEHHAKLRQGMEIDPGVKPPEFLRRLTVDECIAFQDFPRDYNFQCPQSSIFRQLGNSVPPGLSEAIARQLLGHLNTVEKLEIQA